MANMNWGRVNRERNLSLERDPFNDASSSWGGVMRDAAAIPKALRKMPKQARTQGNKQKAGRSSAIAKNRVPIWKQHLARLDAAIKRATGDVRKQDAIRRERGAVAAKIRRHTNP